MKIFAVLIFCITAASSYGQVDKMQLQSCLNIEFASILFDAPKGVSEAEAFKRGYSKANDFFSFYEKQLRNLPSPESTIPEMLKLAGEAGARMAANLTKAQIDRNLNACRASFSKISKTENENKQTIPKSPLANSPVSEDAGAAALARLKPLAKLLNNVLFEDGMIGLSSLIDACYNAPRARGYDCLIMDMGAMYLDSTLNRKFMNEEYFSRDSHVGRVNKAIQQGVYNLEDAQKVQKAILPYIGQALVEDLDKRAR